MNNSFVGHVDLFPIAVGKYKRTDHEQIKQSFIKVLESYPKDKVYTDGEDLIQFFNDGDFNPRQYEGLETFMDWVLESVSDYAETFLGIKNRKFIDLNVWINSNKGGTQSPHVHNNSFISATYYIQLNQTHSGLSFYNPRTSPSLRKSTIDIEPDYQTNYTAPYIPLMVEQGDLLVWPSEVMHGYTQPPVDVPRVTMSMNFLPETVSSKLYGFKISKL